MLIGAICRRDPGKLCPGGRIEIDVAVMSPLSSVGLTIVKESPIWRSEIVPLTVF